MTQQRIAIAAESVAELLLGELARRPSPGCRPHSAALALFRARRPVVRFDLSESASPCRLGSQCRIVLHRAGP
jgi:hypothetical protein